MAGLTHLTPLESAFPSRLRSMAAPPASITLQGGAVEAACTVAVVGSRLACQEALAFSGALAGALARGGAVVVSGGAVGVDAAAHEGALGAGGRTWAVAGTGHTHVFPEEHAALFERIAQGPGAMVWPFAPHFRHRSAFLSRNRVLVALSDVVIVVQAGERSGALHAASCALEAGKPLWVVAAAPWMRDFAGSRQLIAQGARALTDIDELVGALALTNVPTRTLPQRPPARIEEIARLAPGAEAVLEATPETPSHVDSIATVAGQTVQSAAAALLTLALENVVVEGPPGFFRRTSGDKS